MLKKITFLLCSLIPVSAFAVNIFHQSETFLAQISLNLTHQECRALQTIDPSEIRRVIKKKTNSFMEQYEVFLPNGDLLTCTYCIGGPCEGSKQTTRWITMQGQYPYEVKLPVDEKYFGILKDMYEESLCRSKDERRMILYRASAPANGPETVAIPGVSEETGLVSIWDSLSINK